MDIRTKIGSSNYMKAADLQGQAAQLTIAGCREETVGQGADAAEKAVLYFQDQTKGLVLNATNAHVLGEALGFETNSWPGKFIEVFPTTTSYQGRIVDCIRLRIPTAAPVAAAGAPAVAQPVAVPASATPF